jgi:hypothetical protein
MFNFEGLYTGFYSGPSHRAWPCSLVVRERKKGKISAWLLPDQSCGLPHNPVFASLLRQSLEVRKSDLPQLEKGRQLARLVKPWMSAPQAHLLFGESEAVLHGHQGSQPFGLVVYCDYGVTVSFAGTTKATATPDQTRARLVWEWPETFKLDRDDLPPFIIGFNR